MSKQQSAVQALDVESTGVVDSNARKHERAGVFALSSGTTLIPLEQHKAVIEALKEGYLAAFGSLEAEFQAESESVIELRETNDRLRREKYQLEDQLEQAIYQLPEGSVFKAEQRAGLIVENERLTAQINAAQAALAEVFRTMSALVDQVADGVSVIVTAQNPHGQAIYDALDVVDDYVNQYLPVPEGDG